MARPPKNPAERTRPITIHLDPASIEKLDFLAHAKSLSRGGLVAKMLSQATLKSPNQPKSDQKGQQ